MKFIVNYLPKTQQELETIAQDYSQTPEGAAVLCVLALNIASTNTSLTSKVMKVLNPDISNSMLQLIERQLKKNPYVIRSYFLGTSPENGYTIQEIAPQVELSTNRYSGTAEEGKIKFFIDCSGADSPRPIAVRKNSQAKWYAHEFSSLIVGIRTPASYNDNLAHPVPYS